MVLVMGREDLRRRPDRLLTVNDRRIFAGSRLAAAVPRQPGSIRFSGPSPGHVAEVWHSRRSQPGGRYRNYWDRRSVAPGHRRNVDCTGAVGSIGANAGTLRGDLCSTGTGSSWWPTRLYHRRLLGL